MAEEGGAAVKESLAGGQASEVTVVALRSLLDPGTSKQSSASSSARQPTAKDQTRVRPGGRQTKARAKKLQPVTVCEDVQNTLSAQQQYALATDVVNACLKTLTQAPHCTETSQRKHHPSTQAATKDAVRAGRALQPRSGNSSPARLAQGQSKQLLPKSPIQPTTCDKGTLPHIVHTAECAQLAFAHLRSADPPSFGIRELPKWQLENGLLAFAGKLIVHGLEDLAIRQLRHVKRRLESVSARAASENRNRPASSSATAVLKKETMATLLRFDCGQIDDVQALNVAIAYHAHILRIICNKRKPAVIEEAVQYLDIDAPNSPVSLIVRQAKHTDNITKAVKQLDQLSRTLRSLCADISPDADATAGDVMQSASPMATFQLQVLCLSIQQVWWNLAKHDAELSKELLDPFWKCASAFVRRTSADNDGHAIYRLIKCSFETIGAQNITSDPLCLFNIHNLLCSSAEAAGLNADAQRWVQRMIEDCTALQGVHALRAVASIRQITLNVKEASLQVNLEPVTILLKGKLSGNSLNYDLLLVATVELLQALCHRNAHDGHSIDIQLCGLAATFALQFSRSYPAKNLQAIRRVLDVALRFCSATDDLLSWVNFEAAAVMIRTGALESVAELAANKPLRFAWTTSRATLPLSRILQALVVKAIRLPVGHADQHCFDDEQLKAGQRGALLEWQLLQLLELAPKTKYHDTLAHILPELLTSLCNIYSADSFPIRRARVAIACLRLHESHPHLLPPNCVKVWHDTSLSEDVGLGEDAGLQGFREDIATGLAIVTHFSGAGPRISDLRQRLAVWERIVDGCEDDAKICNRIDNPQSLMRQLSSVATYLGMLGEDSACLATQRLLVKLTEVNVEPVNALCHALTDLARQYLQLGYSESASAVLTRTVHILTRDQAPPLAWLDYHVARAEYFMATGDLDQCRVALDQTTEFRRECPLEKVKNYESCFYGLLHACAWLVRSKCLLQTGTSHTALHAAKRSVKILNSLWSGIEQSHQHRSDELLIDSAEPTEAEAETLTTGVSKLQLKPEKSKQATKMKEVAKKGAAFWTLVPVLAKALLHLSDMYAHHGIFHDANYYSGLAMRIAESVGSTALLSRVRSHKSRLLTLAGRLEDAELTLARDDNTAIHELSLALVERYCARANMLSKTGSLEQAIALYDKAEALIARLAMEESKMRTETIAETVHELEERFKSISIQNSTITNTQATEREIPRPAKTRKAPSSKTRKGQIAESSSTKPPLAARVSNVAKTTNKFYNIFQQLRAGIQIQKALVLVQSGNDISSLLDEVQQLYPAAMKPLSQGHAVHRQLMQKAMKALEKDVTLNVLTESTLCIPSLESSGAGEPSRTIRRPSLPYVGQRSYQLVKPTAKTSKKALATQDRFLDLLQAARNVLLKEPSLGIQSQGTVNTHITCAMQMNVSTLLSTVSRPSSSRGLESYTEGLAIDLPRITALQYEQRAMSVDETIGSFPQLLTWPHEVDPCPSAKVLTDSDFQEMFVDILPTSWTAVSLCLSEDASELYMARYNSGKSPLVLRLPFSRHKPEDLGDDVFDYYTGKAELQEIIDLSNYSCHNPSDLERKAFNNKWWSERKALDQRLHELLLNIESIWLGGFKGIFAPCVSDPDRFARFEKSFEEILDRHLPSRQASTRPVERLTLNSRVLELFIGLGDDDDGSMDLDEPLADLLYFVVDMLQFNGERNAYDEIDFDGMTVEVLDALRAYHDGPSSFADHTPQHLILVLDRRLQAFPWESLPCLEQLNVSRVGSMLSLRERIIAQRTPFDGPHEVEREDACMIPPAGTYILNPSSDLDRTQAFLEPTLSGVSSKWTGIIKQAPSEDAFASAITSSSIMLYFGHGAGSQYIGPRRIRRLEHCCNVAWLMGCSSGAVTEHGDLEPSAIPLAYLLAGSGREAEGDRSRNICKAVVATLWDVTDRDIDRFSLRLGEEWGLWPASGQSKLPTTTPKKRKTVAEPLSTPQQNPKAPKTPKVHKSPAPFKTPGNDRTRPLRRNGQKTSLVEAVSRSREACFLRYLNGAAPVIYGIPVYLGD